MPATLFDEFRGACTLDAHTPNAGAWTITPGFASALELGEEPDGNATIWLYSASIIQPSTQPSTAPCAAGPIMVTADYHVSALLRRYAPTGGQSSRCGIVARYNGATTFYELAYDTADDLWHLTRTVAGVTVSLASYNLPIAVGQGVPFALALAGTALVATIGNAGQTPVADALIAGPGRAGIRLVQNDDTFGTQDLRLEQFLAA